ncbi:hypothetical protein QE197_19485 (plasmid) [Arsenophonus nasoniae]|uniref:Uncharacterized protein n=1 Tax=Arsenophonus nasoniae TaxID=638 RepID=A0A4V1BXH6_9GAMM|nr:hypothetical protein [Arsenophonus nasoniae]QBY45723.1 hypothetical protein ArsFIN_43340 [Arsenophonus nasoniae]WGM07973.1 hypothetical protein QE258_22235 [Arsenophonus nasoniae]WGM12884.1 hypothetical protein QE197_19485 [Arsenophonus nasoniae]WGM17589.1 hypothetical protein QE193_19675 [Arsenophonus nasoniae]
MVRNKSPRKRKPVKSGRLPVTSRATAPVYPKRFMISLPPENDDDRPPEFFYDTLKEAIRHCVRLGPQFFLDTQYYPPLVTIIRGFEQRQDQADDAGYDYTEGGITESLPADEFITYTELGIIPVSFEPWDKHTDNWADESDNFCFFGKMPIR